MLYREPKIQACTRLSQARIDALQERFRTIHGRAPRSISELLQATCDAYLSTEEHASDKPSAPSPSTRPSASLLTPSTFDTWESAMPINLNAAYHSYYLSTLDAFFSAHPNFEPSSESAQRHDKRLELFKLHQNLERINNGAPEAFLGERAQIEKTLANLTSEGQEKEKENQND